jgi:hypothetical protein
MEDFATHPGRWVVVSVMAGIVVALAAAALGTDLVIAAGCGSISAAILYAIGGFVGCVWLARDIRRMRHEDAS